MRSAYRVHGCRCQACAQANYVYRKQKRCERAADGAPSRMVNADAVVAHVKKLREHHVPVVEIAQKARCCERRVEKLLHGSSLLIGAQLADRLLGIHVGECRGSVGAIRRVQALFATGWSTRALEKAIQQVTGVRVSSSRLIDLACHGNENTVLSAPTLKAIADAYEKLATVDPVSRGVLGWVAEQARHHARVRGWAPPLAWDDDTIDDPAAFPEGVRSASAVRSVAEIKEDLLELAQAGVVFEVAARRMDYKNPESLRRALYRHAFFDVLQAFGMETSRARRGSDPIAA